VKSCEIYLLNKWENVRSPGLLQLLLPILSQKLESISMDFIIGLPKFPGKDCICGSYPWNNYAYFLLSPMNLKVMMLLNISGQGF